MLECLKLTVIGVLQSLLPQHALSRLIYFIMRIKSPGFKNALIKWFIKQYGVSMESAEKPNAEDYPTFNAFFTRALKADARPVNNEPDVIICPVDGAVSQFGEISAGKLLQAKGAYFDLKALLGDNNPRSQLFADGQFITLYLSPKDYHRIHSPLAGKITAMCHVPGRLFSVNDLSTRAIPELFARNERLVCMLQTELGPVALVMVGALFVSSMETVWQGQITPPGGNWIREFRYDEQNLPNFAKGDELGRFNMGSTVILCFPKGTISWDERIESGATVRMGQALARMNPS